MNNNIVWHHHPVDQSVRAETKDQRPAVIWFTGLSASGKFTLAVETGAVPVSTALSIKPIPPSLSPPFDPPPITIRSLSSFLP